MIKKHRTESDLGQTYTVDQVAAFLQISPRTVKRKVKSGELDAFLVGKSLRFLPETIKKYVNAKIGEKNDQ